MYSEPDNFVNIRVKLAFACVILVDVRGEGIIRCGACIGEVC